MLLFDFQLPFGFLRFLEDGGCCFFIFIAILVVIVLVARRSTASKPQSCEICLQQNPASAFFCHQCGQAFKKSKTPFSFYHNVTVRITNWKKWGWIDDEQARLLANLNQADQEVFGGKKPTEVMVGIQPSQESGEELLDFEEFEVADSASDEIEDAKAEAVEAVSDLTADSDKSVEPVEETEQATQNADDHQATDVGKPDADTTEMPQPVTADESDKPQPVGESATEPELPKPVVPSARPVSPIQPAVARRVEPVATAIAVGTNEIKESFVATTSVEPANIVAAPPAKPPRRLADILRAFMDESNIKLGEFVAGLLIVIGSIGLVTALNAHFENIQYLPSVVFLTIVSLFHVVGIYSLKKWNLVSSSRVILLIGNLLIPLNVFMTTMDNTSLQNNEVSFILAVVVAGVSFGAMSFYSAKLISPDRPWPLVLALMGPCLCQLVVKLYTTGSGFDPNVLNTNALILLPIAFISFAILSEHRYFRKTENVAADDAFSLLRVLGLGIFSLGACIALLFFRVESKDLVIELSQNLSNPLMILCFIIVSSGMLIYRRIQSEDHLKLQMGGMWMAVTGSMGIIIALLLSVPNLHSMIVASFVGAALALIFGYVTRITFLTAAGTLCIGFGVWSCYLNGQSATTQMEFSELRNALADGMTSILFTITAAVTGIIHLVFAKVENRDRPEFSHAGYLGVLLLAAVGLATALASHLPVFDARNPDLTLIVFAVYAVGALIASLLRPTKLVHYIAFGLVAISSLKFANTELVAKWGWLPEVSWLGRLTILAWTMLAAYTVTLIGNRILQHSRGQLLDASPQTSSGFTSKWLVTVTTVSYLVVTGLTFFYIYLGLGSYNAAAVASLLLILIAVTLAVCHRTDWTWMAVQIQTILAVASMVTLFQLNGSESPDFWTWDHHLRIQMIVLSIGMLLWTAFRKISQQSNQLNEIVITDLMYVDFFLHGLATVAVYMVWVMSLVGSLHSIYPDSNFLSGLLRFYGELSGSDSLISSTDWILWGLNLLAWIAVVPDRHRRISSFCGLLMLSALPILASTQLASNSGTVEMSLIHYLKWGYGIFGVIVTSLVCTDRYWWRALQENFPRLMLNQDEKSEGDHAEYTWMALRIVSFIAAALPIIALTTAHFAYTSSVSGIGTDFNSKVLLQADGTALTTAKLNFAGPFFLLVISAWICAIRSLRPLYLIAAFPMWVLGWMFFDLIPIWSDGVDLSFAKGIGSIKWALIGIGIYGLAWATAGLKAEGRRRYQLFKQSTASNFVYLVTAVGVILFTMAAVLDAFVVIEKVRGVGQWTHDWKPAFANWSAFVCAILLPAVCLLFDRADKGKRSISFCLIALVLLNANLAHVFVTKFPGTSVLFLQTVGWLIAITFTVLCFGYLLFLKRFTSDTEESRWDAIRQMQTRWIGWVTALSICSYVAIGIFWVNPDSGMITYSDSLLLSLMALIVILNIAFSRLVQEQTSVTVSLLVTTPLVILAGLKLYSLEMPEERLFDQLDNILMTYNASLIRIFIAGFSIYVIASCLLQQTCQKLTGLSSHPGQIPSNVVRGLVAVCTGALLVHTVIGVVLLHQNSDVHWFRFPHEWGIIVWTSLAVVLSGYHSRFNGWVPVVFATGISLGGSLFGYWTVEESMALADSQIYFFYVWTALAAYLAVWGLVYRFEFLINNFFALIRLPGSDELLEVNRELISRIQFWLGMVVSVVALLSTFYLKQTDEQVAIYRYLAALGPLAIVVGLEALRGTSLQSLRRHVVLHLPLISLVILLWAGISQETRTVANWFHRCASLFIAFALLSTIGYLIIQILRKTLRGALAQLGTNVAGLAVVSLILSLILESWIGSFGQDRLADIITTPELIGISVGLICIVLTTAWAGLHLQLDLDTQTFKQPKPMFVIASMVSILVLFFHLNMSRPEDSIVFTQMVGWLLLLLGSLAALIRFLYRSLKARSEADHQWQLMTGISGIWNLWITFLSVLVIAGCLYFFDSSPSAFWYTSYFLHWCLLTVVVVAFVIFSVMQQDSLTVGLATAMFTVWAFLSVFLIQSPEIDNGNLYDAIGSTMRSSFVFVRLMLASYAILAVLLLAGGRVTGLLTGRSLAATSVVARSARWLTNFSVTGLLIASIVAMFSVVNQAGQDWVDARFEWFVLLLPLVALYGCARYVSSERSSTLSIYAYGSALVSTLLTVVFETAEDPNTQKFVFFIGLSIAIYLAVWGAVYRWQDRVTGVLSHIGVSDASTWMTSSRHMIAGLQSFLGLIVIACSIISTFYLSREEAGGELLRYLSAFIPLLVILGLEVLRDTPLSGVRRHIVLNAPFVTGIVLLWANIDNGLFDATDWYSRIGRLFIVAAAVAVGFVFKLAKSSETSVWYEPLRRMRINTTVTALITLVITLIIELMMFLQERTDFDPNVFEVVGIAAGIIAIAATLIYVGLHPELSPIKQTTVLIQQGYVYVAEILLLVLFGHICVAQPEWFGAMGDYWPMVLMIIAFVGVFVSEIFRKRESHVLSEPIHNTAFLLPTIPILTLWMFPSEGGELFTTYSWIFFGAAILNVLMACLRRSFLNSVVAGIAGNASLWMFFTSSNSFSFADDPQFWVIPPAVSMLIVAQIFKAKLTKQQISYIRYMCLTLVYLTASFDMIREWAGQDGHIAQMLVLGLLSLIGIFSGAIAKIPQFVYLGLIFLIMTLVSMVISVVYLDGELNKIMMFVAVILIGVLILFVITARDKYEEKLKAWIERIESWD